MSLLLLAAAALAAAPPPVWEAREGLAQPESAYYEAGTGSIYVSNVAGTPDGRDGQGWIVKLGPDGSVRSAQWAKGLNAPKGLRACGGRLHVADIDEVVSIDLKTGKTARKVKIEGAVMLNDVAVDDACNVYVSDTLGSRIHRISPKGEASILAQGDKLQSPNGLDARGGTLYVAAWGLAKPDWSTETPGRLLAVSLKSKAVSPVPGASGNLDGLERHGARWLVSDWVAGTVLASEANGQTKVLLHGFKGAADIGLAPRAGKTLLLVPRMGENVVSAYDLDGLLK